MHFENKELVIGMVLYAIWFGVVGFLDYVKAVKTNEAWSLYWSIVILIAHNISVCFVSKHLKKPLLLKLIGPLFVIFLNLVRTKTPAPNLYGFF